MPVERHLQSVEEFAAAIRPGRAARFGSRIYNRDVPVLDAPITALVDSTLR